MNAFLDYIANITYYLLFAAAANMLAPAGKYRKFVSLVTGFVLIVLVLAPLRHVGRDFDMGEFFATVARGVGEFDPAAYAHLHEGQLAAAFQEQLALQLEHLLAREGIVLHEAVVEHSEDFSRITAVSAVVSRDESPARVPFIRIEPVRVNRAREEAEPDPLAAEVKNLIADFYRVPTAHIYVRTQKR